MGAKGFAALEDEGILPQNWVTGGCHPGNGATIDLSATGAPMLRGDSAHSGVQPGPPVLGELSVRWRVETGFYLTADPVILDDVAFVGTWYDEMRAFDADNGKELWCTTIDDGIGATPAIVGDLILVGITDEGHRLAPNDELQAVSEDRFLHAMEIRTGATRWQVPVALSMSAVTVADGVAYFGDSAGIHAIDAISGERLWDHLGSLINSAVAVDHGLAYFMRSVADLSGTPAELIAVDASSGTERWRFAMNEPVHMISMNTAPAVVEGIVYINNGLAIYAVDGVTGREVWHVDGSGAQVNFQGVIVAISNREGPDKEPNWPNMVPALAVADGLVYAGIHGTVRAFDSKTGAERWVTGHRLCDAANECGAGSPAAVGGIVYVAAGHHLLALDAKTGAELQGFRAKGRIATSPVVAGGLIYIGTDEGFVYALQGDR